MTNLSNRHFNAYIELSFKDRLYKEKRLFEDFNNQNRDIDQRSVIMGPNSLPDWVLPKEIHRLKNSVTTDDKTSGGNSSSNIREIKEVHQSHFHFVRPTVDAKTFSYVPDNGCYRKYKKKASEQKAMKYGRSNLNVVEKFGLAPSLDSQKSLADFLCLTSRSKFIKSSLSKNSPDGSTKRVKSARRERLFGLSSVSESPPDYTKK